MTDMRWSKYNFTWKPNEDTTFVFNSRTNCLILNPTKQLEKMSVEESQELLREGFLVEDDYNEESDLWQRIQIGNEDTSTLSMWIFVSNDCNLACTYCWEQGGLLKKNSNMSRETAEKTAEWILSYCDKHQVKELDITYMGGEPCLNMKVIEYLNGRFNDSLESVHYSIITNGVMMNVSMVERMKRIGIHSYQITLDGTKIVHDKRRIYSDGTGTYETILKNIMTIASEDQQSAIVLRMNVDKENMENIPILLRMLKRMEFQRFSAVCLNDTIFEDGIADPLVLKKVVEILKLARSFGFKIAFGELNHCWMMSKAWFMVNQDGLLYKCPSLVGKKEYAIGDVIENIFYPEYEKELSLQPWNECMNCELAGLCQGGCPNRERLAAQCSKAVKVCRKSYLKELLQLKYTAN